MPFTINRTLPSQNNLLQTLPFKLLGYTFLNNPHPSFFKPQLALNKSFSTMTSNAFIPFTNGANSNFVKKPYFKKYVSVKKKLVVPLTLTITVYTPPTYKHHLPQELVDCFIKEFFVPKQIQLAIAQSLKGAENKHRKVYPKTIVDKKVTPAQ